MWGFTVVPLVKAPQSFENWLKGTCSFHVLGRPNFLKEVVGVG